MKTVITLLTFALFTNIGFEKEIENAVKVLKAHKAEIQDISKQYPVNYREALSIVFPEVIRYNAFKDFIETKSLELIYVNFGKDKADFSIGYFQMKPSFIEKLENAIGFCPPSVLTAFSDIKITLFTDEKKIRQERINRLKDFKWQVKYALAYRAICAVLFENEIFENNIEKIKFLAAAYNFGFDGDVNKIKQWTTRTVFPYGTHYGENQMSYSTIAATFLSKYADEF